MCSWIGKLPLREALSSIIVTTGRNIMATYYLIFFVFVVLFIIYAFIGLKYNEVKIATYKKEVLRGDIVTYQIRMQNWGLGDISSQAGQYAYAWNLLQLQKFIKSEFQEEGLTTEEITEKSMLIRFDIQKLIQQLEFRYDNSQNFFRTFESIKPSDLQENAAFLINYINEADNKSRQELVIRLKNWGLSEELSELLTETIIETGMEDFYKILYKEFIADGLHKKQAQDKAARITLDIHVLGFQIGLRKEITHRLDLSKVI